MKQNVVRKDYTSLSKERERRLPVHKKIEQLFYTICHFHIQIFTNSKRNHALLSKSKLVGYSGLTLNLSRSFHLGTKKQLQR